MRKSLILFSAVMVILVLFLASCTLSEQTGKIQIVNATNLTLKDIYIGSTLIALQVNPGVQYDYWVWNTNITGELSISGTDKSELVKADATTLKNVLDDADYTIKPGYLYQARVYIDSGGESTVEMVITKFDETFSASTPYDVVD